MFLEFNIRSCDFNQRCSGKKILDHTLRGERGVQGTAQPLPPPSPLGPGQRPAPKPSELSDANLCNLKSYRQNLPIM